MSPDVFSEHRCFSEPLWVILNARELQRAFGASVSPRNRNTFSDPFWASKILRGIFLLWKKFEPQRPPIFLMSPDVLNEPRWVLLNTSGPSGIFWAAMSHSELVWAILNPTIWRWSLWSRSELKRVIQGPNFFHNKNEPRQIFGAHSGSKGVTKKQWVPFGVQNSLSLANHICEGTR